MVTTLRKKNTMPFVTLWITRAASRAAVAFLLLAVACSDPAAAPDNNVRLVLTPDTAVVAAGDIVHVQVAAFDEDGRPVLIGPVTLTTDHPAVAAIDGSARLRAVSAGRTILRGNAGGVIGSTEIEVLAAPALFELELYQRAALPVLVAADSVEWDGKKEFHEVFVVSGALALTGGVRPRYEILVRHQEYDVRVVDGQRTATLRLAWNEYDRGTVDYDAAGDLAMTSDLIAPLHHQSFPVAGGFKVDFRIPGSDDRLELFYRR